MHVDSKKIAKINTCQTQGILKTATITTRKIINKSSLNIHSSENSIASC